MYWFFYHYIIVYVKGNNFFFFLMFHEWPFIFFFHEGIFIIWFPAWEAQRYFFSIWSESPLKSLMVCPVYRYSAQKETGKIILSYQCRENLFCTIVLLVPKSFGYLSILGNSGPVSARKFLFLSTVWQPLTLILPACLGNRLSGTSSEASI